MALRLALSAGRSESQSHPASDHQDPEQRQVDDRAEEQAPRVADGTGSREAEREAEKQQAESERGRRNRSCWSSRAAWAPGSRAAAPRSRRPPDEPCSGHPVQ